MTKYEEINIILQIISLVLVTIGLLFTGSQIIKLTTQLKQNSEIHKQNHLWNRMIASQNALLEHGSTKSNLLLKDLDIINRKEAIPLNELQAKFTENPELQNSVHLLLNIYESFARGVRQGIYDEEIIKNARKSTMITHLKSFSAYIDFLQTKQPKVLIELITLVNKWQHEDSDSIIRTPTGIV